MEIKDEVIVFNCDSETSANSILNSQNKKIKFLLDKNYIIKFENGENELQLMSKLEEKEKKKVILLSDVIKQNIEHDNFIDKILFCKKIIQLIFKIIKQIIDEDLNYSALFDDPKKILCYLNKEIKEANNFISYDLIDKIKFSAFDIGNIFLEKNTGTRLYLGPFNFKLHINPKAQYRILAGKTLGKLTYKILFNEDIKINISKNRELGKYKNVLNFIHYCINFEENNPEVYFLKINQFDFIKTNNYQNYKNKLNKENKTNVSYSETLDLNKNEIDNENEKEDINPVSTPYKIIHGNSLSLSDINKKKEIEFIYDILEQQQIKIINQFLVPEQIPIYSENLD